MMNFYDYCNGLDGHELYRDEIHAWAEYEYEYPFVNITNILRHKPNYAYRYARFIIKGRWPDAEPYIMKDPFCSYLYAAYVIKGRWTEVESIVMTDPYTTFCYARNVIKGRWIEAEPIILTCSKQAANYATFIIGERWPEAEPILKANHSDWVLYRNWNLFHNGQVL